MVRPDLYSASREPGLWERAQPQARKEDQRARPRSPKGVEGGPVGTVG
jgi:hypothetical protein